MSTETLELIPEVVDDKLAPITKVRSEIIRMRNDYSGLTIKDVSDKKGADAVSTARKEVKSLRVSVDKERKALVEDALRWQQQVNKVAGEITSELKEIETGLEEKEDAYFAEKERVKQEAERLRREKIQNRSRVITSLDAKFDGESYTLGSATITHEEIEGLSDDAFQTRVESFESEYQRLLAERLEIERLAKEEADRLEAVRKEQEAAAAELKRQQDELEAERRKIAEEKAAFEAKVRAEQEAKEAEERRIKAEAEAAELAKQREAELEQAKKEAAEAARVQAELKAKADQEAKEKAERLAKEKEARNLAKRPDIEKLEDMKVKMLEVFNGFTFKTEEGKSAAENIEIGIDLLFKANALKQEA